MSVLRLLQHADSAFPSGSFAFSNGIEGLAMLGGRLDRQSLGDVVGAVLLHRWTSFERPALLRAWRAGGDLSALAAVDEEVESASVVEPLRTGSRRNGSAFLASHSRIGSAGAAELAHAVREKRLIGHLTTAQGCVWRAIGLGEADCLSLSAYQTANGLVTAAVRLGQIGAIDAQAVLTRVLPAVEEALSEPLDLDQPLASTAPFIEIAVLRHAVSDLKLFAN